MRVATALLIAVAFPDLGRAESPPSLSEVMRGATAMTTLRDGSILVAKPDGAFLCFTDVVDLYFQVLSEGRPEIVRQPSAICTSVDNFRNLGEH